MTFLVKNIIRISVPLFNLFKNVVWQKTEWEHVFLITVPFVELMKCVCVCVAGKCNQYGHHGNRGIPSSQLDVWERSHVAADHFIIHSHWLHNHWILHSGGQVVLQVCVCVCVCNLGACVFTKWHWSHVLGMWDAVHLAGRRDNRRPNFCYTMVSFI